MAQDVYVRLPTGLHSELRRRAAEQGVSLNQLCVALLAGGVGFTLEGPAKAPPVPEACTYCESSNVAMTWGTVKPHPDPLPMFQCRACGTTWTFTSLLPTT